MGVNREGKNIVRNLTKSLPKFDHQLTVSLPLKDWSQRSNGQQIQGDMGSGIRDAPN